MNFRDILMVAATQAGAAAAAPAAPTFVAALGYVSAAANATSWTPFTALDLTNCDLAVFVCGADGAAQTLTTASSGWVSLALTMTVGGVSGQVFYKVDPGASEELAITCGTTQQYSGILVRVNGANNISGTGGADDPPSHDAGAVRNHLWLAGAAGDAEEPFTDDPSGYSNFLNRTASGPGGATTAIATKNGDASQTEDPGAFSGGAAGVVCSATVALWFA